MTTTAKMIVGTLVGIPECLRLDSSEVEDLRDVAEVLRQVRAAVLELADRETRFSRMAFGQTPIQPNSGEKR